MPKLSVAAKVGDWRDDELAYRQRRSLARSLGRASPPMVPKVLLLEADQTRCDDRVQVATPQASAETVVAAMPERRDAMARTRDE